MNDSNENSEAGESLKPSKPQYSSSSA